MFYKGGITRVDGNINTHDRIEAIYRIINFGDIYYFAQEISTGCIFPVFTFNYVEKDGVRFISPSHVVYGEYYAFMPMSRKKDEIFKIVMTYNEYISLATVDEVNNYLKEKNATYSWRKKMEQMEATNKYFCDLSEIKNAVSKLNDGVLDFNFNDIEATIVDYKPPIDIDLIKEFGYDLSTRDDLCNLIGRERELKKIIKSIAIKGNSVVLVGEPGSGKTAIVEKLALDIRNGNCKFLEDKVIFCLDAHSLVSGTGIRGQFEEKMNKLINICRKYKGKLILFIDEIHILYGLGRTSDSSSDAMNILKPYLTNGDIIIIGATTKMEYENYMAKDPAFARRLEEVDVPILTEEEQIQVLDSYALELVSKYDVKVNIDKKYWFALLKYIIKITDKDNQVKDGDIKVENPTISKRLLEDAFADAKYYEKEFIDLSDFVLVILDCDKLITEFRKDCAEALKKYIEAVNKPDCIDVPKLKIKGNIGIKY